MDYPRCEKYDEALVLQKIMGPNPLKLEEELLQNNTIPLNGVVMDLGSGQGITSVFLAKEYGFRVYAVDLWSNPADNRCFFDKMGLSAEQITPVQADAAKPGDLSFAPEFFDAVVSIDSYNYFGRDPDFLDNNLLPLLKKGGCIYIVVPGMKKDLHDNLPSELLLSWTPEELDYLHDVAYWTNIMNQSKGAEIISIHEMESNENCWYDWLKCDNQYALGDRKAIEAGGGKYLNFVAIQLRKK